MLHRPTLLPALKLICLAALIILAIVPGARAERFKGPYPYKVAATTGMVADIVRNVAGNRASVEQIIGAGVDPHQYTPARGDIAILARSDVIFYSGLMLEGRMSDVLVKISRSRPVYAVTELIPEDYVLAKSSGHPDPHVWMDVQGWSLAAQAVGESLAEFDPLHAAEYRQQAKEYRERLEALDAYAAKVLATIPKDQRAMITAHDAFQYMGRAYGLEVLGIQGISTESEAGLKRINELVDLIVERDVPAIFVETSVSDKNVRALIEGAASRGHRVVIGGELFSDAMGEAGTYEGTYIGMIDHNATTIARALGGEAPAGGMQGKLAAASKGKD